MSYEIVYDRQFIKTKDERYIPMTLWGSNNVTEVGRGGVERRARDWSPLINGILTRDEFLKYWEDYMQKHMDDYEVGKENILWGMGLRIAGKSSYNDMLNWCKTSMKKAITFEQLKEMGNRLHIRAFHDWENKDLVVDGEEPVSFYTDDETEFMEMYEKVSKGGYKFKYIDANWSEKFGKWTRDRYFPRARRNQNREVKQFDHFYTIHVEGHGYLYKHTARGLKYAYNPMKKYATEKEAQRLVDRYNKKYRHTYKVERVDRPVNILV